MIANFELYSKIEEYEANGGTLIDLIDALPDGKLKDSLIDQTFTQLFEPTGSNDFETLFQAVGRDQDMKYQVMDTIDRLMTQEEEPDDEDYVDGKFYLMTWDDIPPNSRGTFVDMIRGKLFSIMLLTKDEGTGRGIVRGLGDSVLIDDRKGVYTEEDDIIDTMIMLRGNYTVEIDKRDSPMMYDPRNFRAVTRSTINIHTPSLGQKVKFMDSRKWRPPQRPF